MGALRRRNRKDYYKTQRIFPVLFIILFKSANIEIYPLSCSEECSLEKKDKELCTIKLTDQATTDATWGAKQHHKRRRKHIVVVRLQIASYYTYHGKLQRNRRRGNRINQQGRWRKMGMMMWISGICVLRNEKKMLRWKRICGGRLLFIFRHSSKSLSVQSVPTYPAYPCEAYSEILSTIDNDDNGDVMKIRKEVHGLVMLHVLCCLLLSFRNDKVNI